MADNLHENIRRLEGAKLHATADIHMQYLYPWDGVVDTPFGSGWAVVGPSETSRRHMHHEAETWFVTEGLGVLRVDGVSQEVGPGDVVYLAPFSKHELHNPSEDQRLVFLTVWWQDMPLASAHAAAPRAVETPRRVIVNVAPPTPNGDLHLGHLAGPYLGADVYTRYLRLTGVDARYVMGTDDNQSYVRGKAMETDQTPTEVADTWATRIEETLALAGIHVDQFTRPLHAEGYAASIQAVFRQLVEAGHIVAREDAVLVAPEDGRVLFEYYVSGACKACGAGTGGGGCEACGRPNSHVDMVAPSATLTEASPEQRSVRRFVVPLAPHAERLRAFVKEATMPVHLRALAEQLIDAGLPDVPATWPHDWGIPCPIDGYGDQVISAWVELGHGFLESVRRHAATRGWPARADTLTPQGDLEIVHFFGFDNGFVYALLYPLLYELVDPELTPSSTFVCNEFYLLDGRKFSTSRGHAIWVRDLVAEVPADLVRFYLCHTRPEAARTSFSRPALDAFIETELRGALQGWLRDLGDRLKTRFASAAPEPGSWTEAHRQHLAFIEDTVRVMRAAYQAAGFSTQAATRALLELVRRTRAFAAAEAHWASAPDRGDELRTATALELLAARVLAQWALPLMPVFSTQLGARLGLWPDSTSRGLDPETTFVVAGTVVELADVDFG